VLHIEHLMVKFGGLTALQDFSLKMGIHEIIGLVGPNGAGKTTLFNAISGLVKPSGGRVSFNSTDILKKPMYARARMGIGRTFQVPQPMSELTVKENLLVSQRFGTGKVDGKKINEILAFLNLSRKAGYNAAMELSLSELRALEVGKALATNPRLLLLDEVLAGLEASEKRILMGTLTDLHEKYGIGFLIIEHDIETISSLCKRVCVLNFGELIADGTPQEVFRNPTVVKSYIGSSHA